MRVAFIIDAFDREIIAFTPVKSAELNGISEAFVKPFKPDYVRTSSLPNAAIALRQIAGWIPIHRSE